MQKPQPPWGQDVVEQAPWPLCTWLKLTRARFDEQQPCEAPLTFPLILSWSLMCSRGPGTGRDQTARLGLLEDAGLGGSQSTWEVPGWS